MNVALPLTYWVTKAGVPPSSGDKTSLKERAGGLIGVDDQHVIYPINTEYEIFTVDSKQHTLGAVFILNHKEPFSIGAPPVKPIASLAREQNALLDLDKHNWQWSLMLVPVMNIDLYELTNNHIWRTKFGYKGWEPVTSPPFMNIDRDARGWTERGLDRLRAGDLLLAPELWIPHAPVSWKRVRSPLSATGFWPSVRASTRGILL